MNIIKKILAILMVISLVAVVLLTLIFGITGSKYFWGMFILMFFYPIFLWAMSMVYRWGKNHQTKPEDQDPRE